MPTESSRPISALQSLLDILDLERLEENLFRGQSPSDGWQRVFGGQVLGQALVAAGRTVAEPRPSHSLHGYFLLGGDPKHPIIYEVERTRDGGSFTTRRVKAIQHGRIIFTMSVSFHKLEDAYDHAMPMPAVPPPEELPSANEIIARFMDRLPENMRNYWRRERPIELRPVDLTRYLARQPAEPVQHIWMRAAGRLPEAVELHHCVLAYASDFTLLDTALIPHGKVVFDTDIQLASLDHALWFHRPFRADAWLLYSQDGPSAHRGRGFCRGSIYTRDGLLVASVAQEGLIRKRDTAFEVK
ncbi:MAG: acyl-CoA thioesterase II [Hyphomicrobium sp.]|nr:acyl-CoA thioesterase II [Hyphomicrobium sp.]